MRSARRIDIATLAISQGSHRPTSNVLGALRGTGAVISQGDIYLGLSTYVVEAGDYCFVTDDQLGVFTTS